MNLENTNVYVVKVSENEISYPNNSPFNPSENYPEITFSDVSDEKNVVYRSVRELLRIMNLDYSNYNKKEWNPLGQFIKPDNTVVLKPNWVVHYNHIIHSGQKNNMDCTITHGSFIRTIMDYVAIALKGRGRIVILDCPIQGTNWNKLIKVLGLDNIVEYYKKVFPLIKVDVIDGRLGKAYFVGNSMIKRVVDESNLDDYYEIDLAKDSLLIQLMKDKYEFGVSQYPKYRMKKAHNLECNKYLIPKIVLDADVVINLPKFKSHMKSGITCALKNFVGINGHKDYLPHFRFGSPKSGGDEYPDGNWLWDLMWYFEHKDWEIDSGFIKIIYHNIYRFLALLQRIIFFKKRGFTSIGSGSWYGNDTLWRTILDINRCFFYYNPKSNNFSNLVQRKYLCFIDGLIGGHKQSPLAPSPIECGFFISGYNPVALDTVSATLMGFDYRKIKLLSESYNEMKYKLISFVPSDIKINLKDEYKLAENLNLNEIIKYKKDFEPSIGFKGHIELGGNYLL